MKEIWNRTADFFRYLWRRFWFWFFVIGFGIFYTFIYGCLWRRLVKINSKNLDIAVRAKLKKNISLILLSNHKGLIETLLLPLLLWRLSIFYPTAVPISTPDRENFIEGKIFDSNSWWGKARKWFGKFLMGLVPSISIARNNLQETTRAFVKILNKLDSGKGIVLTFFPEGGRTSSEKNPENLLVENGRTMRKFSRGIVNLTKKTRREFIILPVWIDGSDRLWPKGRFPRPWEKLIFHFGRPFRSTIVSRMDQRLAMEYLQNSVLRAGKK